MKIDLLSVEGYTNGHPWEAFRWLRDNDPVHWHAEPNDGPGFWAVTRYEDIRHLLLSADLFASSPSTLLADNISLGDETHRELIFSDPPGHTVHRQSLRPELSVSTVKKFDDMVLNAVTDIIDEVIEKGECDLVKDLAGKLASYVIADVLGLPRSELVDLYETADTIINAKQRFEGVGGDAAARMHHYVESVWDNRHERPRQDLVTRLAFGEIGDCPRDKKQFFLDLHLLILAGGDTTRNAFAGGMAELMGLPEQWAALQQDATLIPTAVDEILRWVAPIALQRRTATQDTQIAGTRIKAGQKVVAFGPAANRDPSVFRDPDVFDIRRSPNPHLTFGTGPHVCLGMHLAKLELATMLQQTLRRLPDIHPTGQVRWLNEGAMATPAVVGPKSMKVAFTPGKSEGMKKSSHSAIAQGR